MSLTKRGYAQLLLTRLFPSPTNDKKITLPQAMLAIAQANNKVRLAQIFQMKMDGTNMIPSQYLNTFTEDVKYDEERCEYYLDLPTKTLSINSKDGTNQSLYFISKQKDRANAFIPTSPNFKSAFKNSMAYNLEGGYSFYQEEYRLFFNQSMERDEKIFMRLLADAEDIGADDYFPVDGSIEQDMMEEAFRMLAPEKEIPQDLISDNISQ